MSDWAVIPARAGSKRIPRKNVRTLCGRPAIAYTVDAALGAGLFDRVIVSTDCTEIAEIAVSAGAEVPFIRRADLADDQTPVSAVAVDVLSRLDPSGAACDALSLMLPNCPLRTAEDVRDSFRQFAATDAEAQISVTRFGWQNPWWAMRRDESMRLSPLFEAECRRRSQDLPALFCPTGAIWWARSAVLRREKTFHTSGRTGWEIPWHRAVDIDTEDDWRMAETLMTELCGTCGESNR